MRTKYKNVIPALGILALSGILVFPNLSSATQVNAGLNTDINLSQKLNVSTGTQEKINMELKNQIRAEQKERISNGEQKGLRLGNFNTLWNPFSNKDKNKDKNDKNKDGDEDDVLNLMLKKLIVEADDTSAEIKWSTNIDASATLMYSTSTILHNATIVELDSEKKQVVTLNDLQADTTYYYKLILDSDEDSSVALIKDGSFTTDKDEDEVENTPSLLWVHVNKIDSNSATILWITLKPTSSKVWVEDDTNVDTTVQSNLVDNTLSYFHKINVKDLEADTTYHFKVASTDKDGNTTISTLNSFTTKVE